jgi:hypothetical protein
MLLQLSSVDRDRGQHRWLGDCPIGSGEHRYPQRRARQADNLSQGATKEHMLLGELRPLWRPARTTRKTSLSTMNVRGDLEEGEKNWAAHHRTCRGLSELMLDLLLMAPVAASFSLAMGYADLCERVLSPFSGIEEGS